MLSDICILAIIASQYLFTDDDEYLLSFLQVGSKGDLLYAHAMSPTDRDEWILALRQCKFNYISLFVSLYLILWQNHRLGCQRLKLTMDRRCHPGAFTDKWSCCQATDPGQNGCQHAFDYSTGISYGALIYPIWITISKWL